MRVCVCAGLRPGQSAKSVSRSSKLRDVILAWGRGGLTSAPPRGLASPGQGPAPLPALRDTLFAPGSDFFPLFLSICLRKATRPACTENLSLLWYDFLLKNEGKMFTGIEEPVIPGPSVHLS